MAVIHRNDEIARDIYLMEVELTDEETGVPAPGQFYMLRGWESYPLLSRPVSVFDYEELPCMNLDGEIVDGAPVNRVLSFLYQVVGEGTMLLAELSEGSEITLEGPFGTGFPEVDRDLTVVGGGIGIAPLYYLARSYRKNHRGRKLSVYLGFSEESYAVNLFEELADVIKVDVGGYVTDLFRDRDFTDNDTVIACGPMVMMQAVMDQIPADADVFVSLEARMACGVGACLGCVTDVPLVYKNVDGIAVRDGLRHVKVCTEGPVVKREVTQ